MPARKSSGSSSASVPVTISLPVRTVERIEALVRMRNISRSELLREWIVEKIADTEERMRNERGR